MTDTSKREELIRAVQAVTWNASNYPPKIQPHVLGQDIVPLTMKIVDAVEAVFEQAHTPTDDEPIAYAVYGRETGRLKYVQTIETLDEVDEVAQFYEVVPLFRRTVQGEPTDAEVKAALERRLDKEGNDDEV